MAFAPRLKTRYVCQNCGATSPRWQGKCEDCGEWNALTEESGGGRGGAGGGPGRAGGLRGRIITLDVLSAKGEEAPRLPAGIPEFDRVTGGGFVRGATVLLGGDPGIGKSTLLLQVAATMAAAGEAVVYVSGEEAVAQVRLRAARLGLGGAAVGLAAETSVEDILATVAAGRPPALLIVDSIQTLWTSAADSAPGTVTQVRASAHALIRYAKQAGTAVVFVGHVTKDGQIAGPRVVEHMVDAVLYFEGDAAHNFRILRSVKNRFGPTDEIGVFAMTGTGLKEVANPSALFLGDRTSATPGAAVFAAMEGTRPLLVEIQALVAPSAPGTPRRSVLGWDGNRLAMVLAVLEAHCGVRLNDCDVYLNVAGGFRIAEPAADLAVAAALLSSRLLAPLPADRVYFGEVSLSGDVRPVAYAPARLKEARKLGFPRAVTPPGPNHGGEALVVPRLADLVAAVAALSPGQADRKTI
jgi:DNA repair protein RadA/Sms